jgi:hypothetical protein
VTDIAALSDMDAVRVLALVVDHSSPLPDAAQQREIETRLRQAAEYAGPEAATEPVSDGDVARATLQHLATMPEYAALIARAVDMPSQQSRDILTLAVGALVVLALQTEVDLTRDEEGQWRLRIHKQAMRESTLANVIGKLLALYRKPPE